MAKRSEFSNKLGFVLAAAGSAVGLGNIWRFPYLAAKYGGGFFLLIYILLVISFGFSIMTAEISIGRKTNLSPIGAFKALNEKFGFIGVIASVVAFLILPYYSVIGGWVIKYFVTFLIGDHASTAQDTFFTAFISSPVEPMIWQVLFVLATLFVIIKGVKGGIEKASKIMMPVLLVLSIIVAIYSITLPGAMEGVKYFLIPKLSDFSFQTILLTVVLPLLVIPKLSDFSFQTILAALGQMFYSLSLAMGIMITYGSYLSKNDDIEKSVRQIELFDTGIAILAGFMVIPAVFAFSGGNKEALSAGPGLMFITLPKVFNSMGMSRIVGVVFFLLVMFAALTSSISLMEAVVATVCDQFKLPRNKAAALVAITAILLGIPSSLGNGIWSNFKIIGMDFLTFMDFITNSVLMPIGALLTCIFIGYIIKTDVIVDEVKASGNFKSEKLFRVMIKYVAPIFIIAILISSVLSGLGKLNF